MSTIPEQSPQYSRSRSFTRPRALRSRRLDLRQVEPAERRRLLGVAFRGLSQQEGLSFLSSCEERELLTELAREFGDEVEWVVLEEGPEVWDVVLSRRSPEVRRRQVLDFMRADHFRIDDLMVKVTRQAQRGQSEVHVTCGTLASALRRHLRMEEEVLMPMVAERLSQPRPPVVGLARDHQQICTLLDEMCEVSARPGSSQAQAHDLSGLADQLEDVLLRHIGLEERVLYAVTDLLATSEERDELVRLCQATQEDRREG